MAQKKIAISCQEGANDEYNYNDDYNHNYNQNWAQNRIGLVGGGGPKPTSSK
jgi:hypothetical protein